MVDSNNVSQNFIPVLKERKGAVAPVGKSELHC